MSGVFIALGANVGDRQGNLLLAVELLQDCGKIERVSKLYQSSAYGFSEQPDFLNAVVMLKTRMQPEVLLSACKKIESKVGRKKRFHWGPREIDLDIIFYGKRIIRKENLTIPHRDFHRRCFVLKPLADIAENFVSPTHGKTVLELLKNCCDTTKIGLISTNWYADGIKI